MAETFIVVLAWATGNDRDGFRINHDWNGQHYGSKEAAAAAGFTMGRADDFNIGVVAGGKLASIWWMDEQLDEDAAAIAAIGQEIGL